MRVEIPLVTKHCKCNEGQEGNEANDNGIIHFVFWAKLLKKNIFGPGSKNKRLVRYVRIIFHKFGF
jgi:hypothetical protein